MAKKSFAKIAAVVSVATLIAGTTAVCTLPDSVASAEAKTSVKAEKYTGKTPKYIFMFIGDGMSYPQIQATADYYSALADTNNNGILEAKKN